MYPVLLNLPLWPVLLLGGGLFAHLFIIPFDVKGTLRTVCVLIASLVVLGIGLMYGAGGQQLPIRGYGSMVLAGFLLAVCEQDWPTAHASSHRDADRAEVPPAHTIALRKANKSR